MQNVWIWWIKDIFRKLWYEKFAFDILRDIEVGAPNSGEGYWRNFESPLNLIEQFTFRPPPLLVFNFLREKNRQYFVLTEPASVTGAFREEIQFVLVEQICAVSRVVGLGMENHNPPLFSAIPHRNTIADSVLHTLHLCLQTKQYHGIKMCNNTLHVSSWPNASQIYVPF